VALALNGLRYEKDGPFCPSWNIEPSPLNRKFDRQTFPELATLECIRAQCNSEGKVAKYSRFFRPLPQTIYRIWTSFIHGGLFLLNAGHHRGRSYNKKIDIKTILLLKVY
jgi:hypothetical protein